MIYVCMSFDISFCFKCPRWKEEFHPHDNSWSSEGAEFEETEENEEETEPPESSPKIE